MDKNTSLTYCITALMIGIMAFVFMVTESSQYVWIPSCTTSGGGHWGPREYYDSAPDGWYYVCCGSEKENGEVWFPLCPSSGTRLHGEWKCNIFLEENYDGNVRVENNVIVEKG